MCAGVLDFRYFSKNVIFSFFFFFFSQSACVMFVCVVCDLVFVVLDS